MPARKKATPQRRSSATRKTPKKRIAKKQTARKATKKATPVAVGMVRVAILTVSPAGKCVRQTTKKYTTRDSPAFPANECCGVVMRGQNAGRLSLYRSEPDKNGVCRWIRK